MAKQINQTRTRASSTGSTYLTVLIGGVLHAIPIEFIEEILPALPVEYIAQLPSFVRGIVYVRGHLIPVLDGAHRLELSAAPKDVEHHLVCLNVQGRIVGLEIDEAIDLMELPFTGQIPVPEFGGTARFLSAVIDHQGEIIRILNPDKLLLQEETAQLAGGLTSSPT